MLEFLSPAWLAALDRAARADDALRAAAADVQLVVEQRVEADAPDGPGDSGNGSDRGDEVGATPVVFHVVLDRGDVRVVPGPADGPTIRFSQDLATARGIASGWESAQRAFMTGRLRVGGDLRAVLDNQEVLSALDETFAEVRARTDLPAAPSAEGTGRTGRTDGSGETGGGGTPDA